MSKQLIKSSHCTYCGAKFDIETWPRMCGCGNESYRNPTPVVVGILPVHMGPPHNDVRWLIQQRNIEPQKLGWSLTSGYMEFGETWQEALVREMQEEIGIETATGAIDLFDVVTASNGNLLIFGVHTVVPRRMINFKPNKEVSDIRYIEEPKHQKLCFPTHNEMLARYYAKYIIDSYYEPWE